MIESTLYVLEPAKNSTEQSELITQSLHRHHAFIKESLLWSVPHQDEVGSVDTVNRALSTLQEYSRELEDITQGLLYPGSEKTLSLRSTALAESFHHLETFVVHLKSELYLDTRVVSQHISNQSGLETDDFSSMQSPQAIMLQPWAWVNERSLTLFSMPQTNLIEPVEPLDISEAVSVGAAEPQYTGPWSQVFKGKYQGFPVAVKMLRPSGTAAPQMIRRFKRELRVWGALRHPSVLPLVGYAQDDDQFGLFGALISPWCENGNAAAFLETHGSALDLPARITLWEDVVAGVDYLHSQHPTIVHGDLKPQNILIDNSGHAMLADFGLVRLIGDQAGEEETSPHTGTTRYLAHELITGDEDRMPTTASDIYSLGCVGLVFIFNRLPYENRRGSRLHLLIQDIIQRIPPAQRPIDESQDSVSRRYPTVWDLLEQCWKSDPSARPTSRQLVSYLSGRSNIFRVDNGG